VKLQEDSEVLDEVVVVGYGVQKKSDVTGALTQVSSKELTTRPVINAFEALQGKAAGVDITTSERPGTLGSIKIRGTRSLDASKDPLYVVDGVPLQNGDMSNLNPRDIESINVLKDASSTAIYGSRGANGVILITTKRGRTGALSLNYAGSVTFETLKDKTEMMNADEFITWRRWAFYNAGKIATPGNEPNQDSDEIVFADGEVDAATYNNIMNGWKSGTWDASQVKNTDWTGMVTRTGITQEHSISASGGTDKFNAYASFGY
jgi:TonB-dependent SusC/RagA subfamily outer membrane receptor